MHITKAQYDKLVIRFPRWMAEVWPTLEKSWHLGTCYISKLNPAGVMHELICNLKAI